MPPSFAGPMRPVLTVIQCSSSFEHIWEAVARATGAQLNAVNAHADRIPAGVVLISAGGAEPEAVAIVSRLSGGILSGMPTAVVGALPDHRLAVRLLSAGADEYFVLPSDMDAMSHWLNQRIESFREQTAGDAWPDEPVERYDYSKLIGRSAAMRDVLMLTTRITPHRDASVLITGETGTGKELIAHAIHFNGPRSACPFVEINCSALPATLLEAELFGYEAGAFTDARAPKPGLFEVAKGGTLLLDEIGELPLDMQAKLLRVLEEKRVRRLGATKSSSIDVRVIAATHVDLAGAVRAGRFRQDLYYRLDVFRIHLPPLRDRPDDILPLAEHFLRQFNERHRTSPVRLTPEMRRAFLSHSWPGNVRELRNAIERAVIFGPGSLRLDDGSTSIAAAGSLPFPSDMESIQQAAARAMVERHRGNKTAAAGALGISRKRLYCLLTAAQQAAAEVTRPPDRLQGATHVHESEAGRRAPEADLQTPFWL